MSTSISSQLVPIAFQAIKETFEFSYAMVKTVSKLALYLGATGVENLLVPALSSLKDRTVAILSTEQEESPSEENPPPVLTDAALIAHFSRLLAKGRPPGGYKKKVAPSLPSPAVPSSAVPRPPVKGLLQRIEEEKPQIKKPFSLIAAIQKVFRNIFGKKEVKPRVIPQDTWMINHFAKLSKKGRMPAPVSSKLPVAVPSTIEINDFFLIPVLDEEGMIEMQPMKPIPDAKIPGIEVTRGPKLLHPFPTRPAPTVNEAKNKLLLEELTKPVSEDEVRLAGLGKQLCDFRVFGDESLRGFMTYPLADQNDLLNMVMETLEEGSEEYKTLVSFSKLLNALKDEKKDSLKTELHAILRELIDAEFIDGQTSSEFLVGNVVQKLEFVNGRLRDVNTDVQEYTHLTRPLIRLGQVIYELHRIDLPAASKEEGIHSEIITILNQLNLMGVLEQGTLERFPSRSTQTQLDQLDGAIATIKTRPHFAGLVENIKRLKTLIIESKVTHILLEFEAAGMMRKNGAKAFQENDLATQKMEIDQIRAEITDGALKQFADSLPKLNELENLLGA